MELKVWKSPKAEDIPASLQEFLTQLAVPTAIHLPGEDPHRTRVLVTLTHGNEPSGVQALHPWLKEGKTPKVNIVIILGSIRAALTEPIFYHRQLPGVRDLNRCFNPPYERDQQGRLALAILEHIRKARPEAVVDMHNTSGTSGPFAVTFNHNPRKQALASLFVEHLIVSKIRLGALMEQDPELPIVTLEAGGSDDPASPIMARRSIERYFMTDDLFSNTLPIMNYEDPLRLEIKPSFTLSYSDQALPEADVTICKNVESFSFNLVDTNNLLGWIKKDIEEYFTIRQSQQTYRARDFFQRDGQGCLRPKRAMRLFMATNRPDIAVADCLFYFICL